MAEMQIDEDLVKAFEERLTQRHGLMLPSAALATALGYPTMRAYHQAVSRQTIPVPLFQIEHRRGRFALTRDVARWLAQQYQRAEGPWRLNRGTSRDAEPASFPSTVLAEERSV